MTHQLQLAKDEIERANAELAKKSEEYSTYRRDKHTELIQLQAELDSVKQTHAQTLSSLRALQSSHNSQKQQLSDALQKVHDLTAADADQERTYSSEVATLRRLLKAQEELEEQLKEYVASLEREWDILRQKAEAEGKKLQVLLDEEKRRSRQLEDEVAELKRVLDRVNSEVLPVPAGPRSSPNESSDGLSSISSGISMISRMQKSGKTFTQVYSEYVEMEKELESNQREIDNLDQAMADVCAELGAVVRSVIRIIRVVLNSTAGSSPSPAKTGYRRKEQRT